MSEEQKPADFGADDASEDAIIMARDTIVGDLRDMILDQLRHNHDALPWNARTENKQRETVELVTKAVQHAVDKAVRLIASDGRPFLMGTLAKVQIKDGIQAQINLSKSDPLRHSLIDAQGQTVMVIVADSDAFSGTRGDVKTTPDQSSLIDGDEAEDGKAAA